MCLFGMKVPCRPALCTEITMDGSKKMKNDIKLLFENVNDIQDQSFLQLLIQSLGSKRWIVESSSVCHASVSTIFRQIDVFCNPATRALNGWMDKRRKEHGNIVLIDQHEIYNSILCSSIYFVQALICFGNQKLSSAF